MHDFYFARVVSRLYDNYVVDIYANTYFSQYNRDTTTWLKEPFCLLNVTLDILYIFAYHVLSMDCHIRKFFTSE